MDPLYLNKEKIASLLPMDECISVMERMFRSLANGECLQPLRTLMRLPDKSGIMGMMPGYATGHAQSPGPAPSLAPAQSPGPAPSLAPAQSSESAPSAGIMGIKIITIFPGNNKAGHKQPAYPSHQGIVILFGAEQGEPLMLFDAAEITAIRTAAASAVATRLLSREDAEVLAIIGTGEQAERHIEAILLVRKIKQINLWGRNELHSRKLAKDLTDKYAIPVHPAKQAQDAIRDADIICTVTASKEPVVLGEWISAGTHINAVGSSTPVARELDTLAVRRSKLYTDCYESLFNEAGDFIIPKTEGLVTDGNVSGEIGEVLTGRKKGRENSEEITLFKSLGIAAEDLFAARHIYDKIK